MTTSPAGAKAIAGVRIATSVFFLLFGEYKLAGPGFAHGGFQGYLHDFITNGAVGFYRPGLSGLGLPHAVSLWCKVRGVGAIFWNNLLLRLLGAARAVFGVLHMLRFTPG